MGYVHSYHHTTPVSDADWELCVSAFSRIVEDALGRGIALSRGMDAPAFSNHDIIRQAWHETTYVHGASLRINGVDDTGCETFVLWQGAAPIQPWQMKEGGYDGFMSVKTQMHPYDDLVTAFLCWLHTRLPHTLDSILSDGSHTEWQPGCDLASRLFPDLQIVNPLLERLPSPTLETA